MDEEMLLDGGQIRMAGDPFRDGVVRNPEVDEFTNFVNFLPVYGRRSQEIFTRGEEIDKGGGSLSSRCL